MSDLLRLSQVSKWWPGVERPVLRDASLRLGPSDYAWLQGSNGAGKTTLLRLAAGLLRPDAGSVRSLGLDPHDDRREYQRQVQMLSATSAGLYARLSTRRHLEYWARLALVSQSDRAVLISRAVEDFNLGELLDRRVDRMSMGQRQRVRLASVFLPRTDLVLLDEPGNSLDEDGIELLNRAIGATLERRAAVVWCAPAGDAQPANVTRILRVADSTVIEAAG